MQLTSIRAYRATTNTVIPILYDNVVPELGDYDYSAYYEGTGPLIYFVNHGGYITTAGCSDDGCSDPDIPDRHAGCWDGTQCIWEQGCTPPDDINCGIVTARDRRLNYLGKCIYDNTIIYNYNYNKINIQETCTFTPHLIVNGLHRSKLDSNREIGEAALGNPRAENTWHEIHKYYANRAKYINMNNCNFAGLVVDLHGQSNNSFIHLGYNIGSNNLPNADQYEDDASIRSLIIDNGLTVTEAFNGMYSLGTLLEQYGYSSIPSSNNPTDSLPTGIKYYTKGETLTIHGSQLENSNNPPITDAIMVEINSEIRDDIHTMQQFCLDFSKIIVEYINKWYNLDQCICDATLAATCTTTDPNATPKGESNGSTIDESNGPTTDKSNEPTTDESNGPTTDESNELFSGDHP